jgi:hypothetical protein
MTIYEMLFTLSSIAMPFWFLMILLPTWRFTRFLANTTVFPLYLSVLYTIGLVMTFGNVGFGFISDFSSAEGVVRLLSDPDFALLGWLHLLCFDMAIAHFVYRENMEHRYVPLPIQSILLFFILMSGPFGWLCYVALSIIRRSNSRKSTVRK